ncbi:MAG: nucleotide-binding protein [Treponema sp.]|nr:nucleotide-binding protein [Treponema sp.]
MYYHVIIEDKSKKTYYEQDIQDKNEIIRRFVKPYIQGEQIQIDGYFLQKPEIARFKITQSEYSAELERKERLHELHQNGFLIPITPVSWIEEKQDITELVFEEVKKMRETAFDSYEKEVECGNKKVFIVHGHDKLAKTEVARFLEKLGLTPVILSEQPNEGKTIIEKLEAHTDAGFGIVIYAPDDEGRLILQDGADSESQRDSENQLRNRARQNVVFEHGLLIGKLGRNRVVALKKGNLEVPNDISGVVYIEMDDQGAWCFKVAKELKAAGYIIDMNKLAS